VKEAHYGKGIETMETPAAMEGLVAPPSSKQLNDPGSIGRGKAGGALTLCL
jgi:hypothetical protein